MITRFQVQNYKSIRNLDLAMRPFMVLVGPNGAGKTNIVSALQLFGEILDRGTTDPVREQGWDQVIRRGEKPARGGLIFRVSVDLPPRILRQSFRKIPSVELPLPEGQTLSISASLTLSGAVGSDAVRVRDEALEIRVGPNSRPLAIRSDANGKVTVDAGDHIQLVEGLIPRRLLMESAAVTQRDLFDEATTKAAASEWFGTDEFERDERRVLRVLNWVRLTSPWMRYLAQACDVSRLRLDASALRTDAPYKDSTGSTIGGAGEGLAWAVDRLKTRRSETFDRVLSALQQVYPRIEDIRPHRVQPGRLVLYFKERGIAEELGPTNISDGVLHALALLVMLEARPKSDGILAIEEPENAIHPWSVRTMIIRAQEAISRQVVITTHSETVVNAVADPRNLFIVEIDDAQGTRVAPVTERENAIDAILRESGQKLGEVWLGGGVGGVPQG